MSIHGIGIDLIEHRRIARALSRHPNAFCRRVYTPAECSYCNQHRNPTASYAARWAAKEAVAKALGTGIGAHCALLDIEVTRAASGQPGILLHRGAHQYAQQHRIIHIHLSLSHSQSHAIAHAVAETTAPS